MLDWLAIKLAQPCKVPNDVCLVIRMLLDEVVTFDRQALEFARAIIQLSQFVDRV